MAPCKISVVKMSAVVLFFNLARIDFNSKTFDEPKILTVLLLAS